MDAGAVYGVGMKGKVMDYGTTIHDVDSLQHMTLTDVKKINLYVLQDDNIVETTMGPELLDELIELGFDRYQDRSHTTYTISSNILSHLGETLKAGKIKG